MEGKEERDRERDRKTHRKRQRKSESERDCVWVCVNMSPGMCARERVGGLVDRLLFF